MSLKNNSIKFPKPPASPNPFKPMLASPLEEAFDNHFNKISFLPSFIIVVGY